MATTAQPGSSFQQLLEDSRGEYEQTQTELKEIELLIQQTAAEVDRLVQRNAQATNRLRQIESVFDSVPRSDIREAYAAVQDSQQRLFTMRGQLEKLQSDQKNLERLVRLLRRVMELSQRDRPSLGDDGAGMPGEAVPTVVRVIEAQERERQRLARQIHDGPAQSLTNLILQAEICERLLDVDPDRARAELAGLKTSVASTFQRVKDFIVSLRPMMLDDLGLIPTLRRYVDDRQNEGGLSISLTVTGRDRRIADYKEVTIFRVVQELLANARQFSHASSVQIAVDLGDERVLTTVEDNGGGFEAADLTGGQLAEEMGLNAMRERVEMLQGRFQVESRPGRGTRIILEVPLP